MNPGYQLQRWALSRCRVDSELPDMEGDDPLGLGLRRLARAAKCRHCGLQDTFWRD